MIFREPAYDTISSQLRGKYIQGIIKKTFGTSKKGMEKMYISGNMDKSLIRKNPITAISMEKDDLFMLLRKGLSPFITDEM